MHQGSFNAYLRMAYEAIIQCKRPLSPAEILDFASREGFLPAHLFGATMHKTLAARLAEHIREQSSNSAFFRTAPAKFFLHELALLPDTPPEYTQVYVGHLRAKSIRRENVLVAGCGDLQKEIYGEFIPYNGAKFDIFLREKCRFVDRVRAEADDLVKQFVTFTMVVHDTKLLIYRRGKFTSSSDTLKGQLSVGFGGHINDTDFDLFTASGEDAFKNNAARELKEELFLDQIYSQRSDAAARTTVLGFINVDDSADAQHHIAVLVVFKHRDSELPKKGELSINQLEWLDLENRVNDLSSFDLWSGMILRNFYSGRIRLSASNRDGNKTERKTRS